MHKSQPTPTKCTAVENILPIQLAEKIDCITASDRALKGNSAITPIAVCGLVFFSFNFVVVWYSSSVGRRLDKSSSEVLRAYLK